MGTVKTTYTYGPGLDEVLLQEQGTTALYLLRDGLNSTIAATNATGAVVERYAYDAYGQVQVQNAARQPIATAPQTPWLFTGRYYPPESKLYDFRNRAYHPAVGRFMQVDPVGFAAKDVNLYRYVGNNPVSYSDLLGLSKGGRQRISGDDPLIQIGKNASKEVIDDAIKRVEKALVEEECMSIARKQALRAWLKVAKRGFTMGIPILFAAQAIYDAVFADPEEVW